jgi:hypothetical protein
MSQMHSTRMTWMIEMTIHTSIGMIDSLATSLRVIVTFLTMRSLKVLNIKYSEEMSLKILCQSIQISVFTGVYQVK